MARNPLKAERRVDAGAAYAVWAATYDTAENRTRDLDAAVLRREGPDPRGRRVVEFGCGTGKNTAWLAEAAASVLAFDLSDAMLERARARVAAPHVRFVRHDLRVTPWPADGASAELIVGNLVLEHVRDLQAVLREAARVARPGCELFLCELHPYRQLAGGGVEIPALGAAAVEAYVHSVSEYANAAVDAGFAIARLGEWCDADDRAPRLLSVRAVRRAD